MPLKITYGKAPKPKSMWTIIFLSLVLALLAAAQPGNTEDKTNKNQGLPQSPDTGSPEEDFSAGGTRDNYLGNRICGKNNQAMAYLLGNRNRELTLSAYPTFWLHIPHNLHQVSQIKFVLAELETGNQIYNRVIPKQAGAGIIGIALPQEKKYALSPEINYTWSLEVHCAGTDNQEEIALQGWLYRLPLGTELQNQLATTSESEKYKVYLEHDLLYDALTEVAQRRIAEPNNTQTAAVWHQLLAKLGWQDLIQQPSAINPSILDR